MGGKVVGALVITLALSAGCTSAAGNASRGTPAVDAEKAQAWALSDGVVTEAEYRTAIERFISCVRDAGYEVTDPVLSPIDRLTLLYDLTANGDRERWNKRIEYCNDTEVSYIEPRYVEAREQVMEPSLRAASAECLNHRGFELTGNERNVRDFVKATNGSTATVMECVTPALQRLFPNVPGFLKVRW